MCYKKINHKKLKNVENIFHVSERYFFLLIKSSIFIEPIVDIEAPISASALVEKVPSLPLVGSRNVRNFAALLQNIFYAWHLRYGRKLRTSEGTDISIHTKKGAVLYNIQLRASAIVLQIFTISPDAKSAWWICIYYMNKHFVLSTIQCIAIVHSLSYL